MNNGSRVWGTVLTLGLTVAALGFVAGMTDEARVVHDPTPVFGIIVVGVVFVFLWRGPVGRAIGKMLEGGSGNDDALQMRVDQLEAQIGELSIDQHRVLELEERLDFAERLLSQRDPQGLPRGDQHG